MVLILTSFQFVPSSNIPQKTFIVVVTNVTDTRQ